MSWYGWIADAEINEVPWWGYVLIVLIAIASLFLALMWTILDWLARAVCWALTRWEERR